MTDIGETIVRKQGHAGRITLNRPEALNALTLAMVHKITRTLDSWRNDDSIEHVILDGSGDKALCAGGDIISFYDARPSGPSPKPDYGAIFWRDEYRLNAAIHRYTKPFTAVMDGIVMGGGVGLSAHCRHRIVTEKTMVAMPETTIGLIPDVGGTFLLGRAQGRFGEYLGLTGARMNGSDAIQAGFADVYVSRAAIPALIDTLASTRGGYVDAVIDEASEPVPPSPLSEKRDLITRIFAADNLEAIADAALRSADPLAQKVRADLQTRSPLALKLALEAIRRARKYETLEDALEIEYRLVTRLFSHGEFAEGVRALLIDKDKAPKWNPATLAEVTAALVDGFFAPLPPDQELSLARP